MKIDNSGKSMWHAYKVLNSKLSYKGEWLYWHMSNAMCVLIILYIYSNVSEIYSPALQFHVYPQPPPFQK